MDCADFVNQISDIEQLAWNKSLADAGFRTQFTAEGLPGSAQLRFTLAALESEATDLALPREIVLVEAANASESANNVAAQLKALLKDSAITRIQWNNDLSAADGKACIVLADLETSILSNISRDGFGALQQLVTRAESLLWICGDTGPDASMISGLARSIRNEIPGVQFRTLQIENKPLDSFPGLIDRVLRASNSDTEFRVLDGMICVNRFSEDNSRNEALATNLGEIEPKVKHLALKDTAGPVKLCIKNPGMLDSLCFEPDSAPEVPLEAGKVEVDVKASGIKYVVSAFID